MQDSNDLCIHTQGINKKIIKDAMQHYYFQYYLIEINHAVAVYSTESELYLVMHTLGIILHIPAGLTQVKPNVFINKVSNDSDCSS